MGGDGNGAAGPQFAGLQLDRPNVIVVLCDQLRSFEVGCYGNDIIRTPHIDRLAAEGVRFDCAVSPNPVCMAARSALLSGQYSRTCQGFLGNYSERLADGTVSMPEYPEDARRFLIDPTLPEQLKAIGYETTLIGKWHVQPSPPRVGFDYSLYPRVHHRHTAQTFVENDPPDHWLPDGSEGELIDGFSVDYEAAAVRQYLNSVDSQRPFFLYYSISPPHMPLDDAPEEYKRMYSPDEIPLRDNVWQPDGSLPFDERWFQIYLWDFLFYQEHLPHTERLPEGFTLRHLIALYYGLTTWVDDQIGRLMEGLRENHLLDNTIVLFASDHGDNLGSHGLFNKGRLIEESIRIPMIWWSPGRWSADVRRGEVASLIDVMPTVLDLCGGHTPSTIQGRSLAAAIRGDGSGPDHAFIETGGGEIGLRTVDHLRGLQLDDARQRLTDEPGCLYDLTADPFELSNRAEDQADDLARRLRNWHGDTPIREAPTFPERA
jgi:arylsulfatase A-like enzyme